MTDSVPDPAVVVRWAHQGGAREAPSNTLAAMERAMSSRGRATALEMDVHCTSDGAVVVLHDGKLDRTTDGSGSVRRHKLDSLQAFNAAWWWVEGDVDNHHAAPDAYPHRHAAIDPLYRIPTIDEVLDRFPTTPMTIEIKAWRAARPLIDKLAERDRRDVTVTSFFDPFLWLARLRQRRHRGWSTDFSPGTMYMLWFRLRVGARLPPRASRYARIQIPIRKAGITFATPRFVVAAHAAGMLVDVWTIDDEETMRALVAPDGPRVDGIMTDRPSVLAAAMGV